MKNNRVVLPVIIILLIIFLPLTGYTIYAKIFLNEDNPEHLEYYNGYFYIFDNNDEILVKYMCPKSNCDYVYLSEVDENNEEKSYPLLPSNGYAFIKEDDYIIVYDYQNNNKILRIDDIVSKQNENEFFVVRSEKYGLLSINPVSFIIPAEYNTLSIDKYNNENDSNNILYLANDYENYYIINGSNEKIFTDTNEIVEYTENIVIVKDNALYKFYSYDKTDLLNNYNIIKYLIYQNNIYIEDPFNKVTTLDRNYNVINEESFFNEVEFEIEDGKVVYK